MKALVVSILLLIFLIGCGDERGDDISVKPSTLTHPDKIITDAEVYLLKGGKRAGVIISKKMLVYDKLDTTLLYDLTLKFFDTTGTQVSTLTADSAQITHRKTRLAAAGHVRAWTESDRRLETDSLRWNSETGKIETEGFVTITRGEDRISGWGLETDERLEKTVIKRNTHGEFTDPAASDQ